MEIINLNKEDYVGKVLKEKFDIPNEAEKITLNGNCVICGRPLKSTEGDGLFVCLKCRKIDNE